jgi:hypothetical protein
MMAEGFGLQVQKGLGLANSSYPHLQPYAPNVGYEQMQNRPDVAGRFDPDTRSVMLNLSRSTPLSDEQTGGLISLERARGLLFSPLGQQFTDNFPLDEGQQKFWDSFYLPEGVDAPIDQAERNRILKSTILSRLLVGDDMPSGAPPLTMEQMQMADLFATYAGIGRK